MSAFDFNVTLTRDITNWGTLLVDTLKDSFEKLNSKLDGINDRSMNVKQELIDLNKSITKRIDTVQNTADEALRIAKANSDNISTLQVQLQQSNAQSESIKSENIMLQRRCDDMEIYSRKKNLVIKGIREPETETDQQCIEAVQLFFKNQLKLNDELIQSIRFVRCHRLGYKEHNRDDHKNNRPIIVRFVNFDDRQIVWKERFTLKNDRSFFINENYPRHIEYNRRKLLPLYTLAKKNHEYDGKVFLKGDRLIIKGDTFTVDSIENMPENVHPRKLCTVENEVALVSGGLLSEFSFLSNYSPCDLNYEKKQFKTLEQCYGYIRAKHFNDVVVATKILKTNDPAEVKRLGYKVRGFRASEWNKVKEDIMLKLLRMKFSRGNVLAEKLKATGTKQLAESGKDMFFSCGLPLMHPNVLDTTKWGSNMLGKLQMKIRNELNQV